MDKRQIDGEKKFVIWGAGFKGRQLLSLLKPERIIAFIDSDSKKIGSNIEGIPIISFDIYCQQYYKYFIIISPIGYEDIEVFLRQNGIAQYTILKECPSELQGYGIKDISRLMDWRIDDIDNIVIVGSNLYSILLYERFTQMADHNIVCYANEARTSDVIESMSNLLDMNVVTDVKELNVVAGRAFITTRESRNIDQLKKLKLEIVQAYDFSYKIKEYYNKDILQFKNMHEGKRCFIVATGPSLRMDDLNTLYQSKDVCFGVNRIFNICDTNWKPNYYMIVDKNVISQNVSAIINYDVNVRFWNSEGMEVLDGKYKNTYKVHVVADDVFDVAPDFSEDASRVLYGGSTVTYACIQMAVYMGFKEIILLGVDCNYVMGSKSNYFFNTEKEDKVNHREDRMIMAYQAAKQYADAHDIKILNATRGGMLEVFERVNFDELFH